MDYRCKIIFETKKYFIGKTYGGKIFKIRKNINFRAKIGDDFYFYAAFKKGIFIDMLIPVSDMEAGVV